MERKRRSAGVLILIFIISFVTATFVYHDFVSSKYNNDRERASYIASSQAGKLEYVINTLLNKTHSLKLLIIQSKGKIENFNQVAMEIWDDSAIRAIQLAPDGIVNYVYPMQGNEGAGGNLFENPKRRDDVIKARDSKVLTMSGPYELAQGGMGIVGRMPIYLNDENGHGYFWGFANIVLNLPEAFHSVQLDTLVREKGISIKYISQLQRKRISY